MTRAALGALVVCAVASGGCLFGDVDGIPCGADSECPTDYFCDLPHATCAADGDDSSVPDLKIGKVRDPSGKLVILPKVPEGTTAEIGLQLVNQGKTAAGDIGLTFAPLECTEWRVPVENLPDEVKGGATVEMKVELVTGPGCGGVKIVDWFLAFSGRTRRGTFDLNILDQ
jgi:hypothetical protein